MQEQGSLSIYCSSEPSPFDVLDPVHQPLLSSSVDLWYAPIEPLIPFREELRSDLSEGEQKRADRFRFEKDRNRFIIGHFLLRNVLAKYLSTHTTEISFGRAEFGKPYLLDHKSLRFNFSDTKDAILIGVTKDCEIGVDIETLNRELDHEGVADHYFTDAEIKELKNSSEPKRRFLEYWTRKEAILKSSGVGIMDDVRVLQVSKNEQQVQISHADMKALSAPSYYVHSGYIGTDHILSVATPHKQATNNVYDALAL